MKCSRNFKFNFWNDFQNIFFEHPKNVFQNYFEFPEILRKNPKIFSKNNLENSLEICRKFHVYNYEISTNIQFKFSKLFSGNI